jgi:catechol 2,3-dioxygenase-like lactoylglutathione lyase family enzyme
MPSGIAGIDHVIVAVRDLESARRGWVRLGFKMTPRGRHIGQATANYCIMFADDYLELLGAVAPDAFADRLNAFLAQREGPMSAAFALSGSPEEVRSALLSRALHPSEPRSLARELELPDGGVAPRFSLMTLPADETPGLDCFLCGHLTPELLRRPDWLVHANGAVGLKGIDVLVAETAPLLAAWDRLLGIQRVTTTDAVAAVAIGRHRILFSTPDDFLTMHPGLDVDPDFPLPGIIALELTVANRARTADFLGAAGIRFAELPGGSLAVMPGDANGAFLFFGEWPPD